MSLTRDLFLLIARMSPNEKRFFKLYAKKHQGKQQPNHILVFDAINQLQKPDEEQLRKKLKGKAVLDFLASEKRKLYSLILDALFAFTSGKDGFGSVTRKLNFEEILRAKGLHKQALNILLKAKKEAIQTEAFFLQCEILLRERTLIKHLQPAQWQQRLEALWDESRQARLYLNDWLRVREMHDRVLSRVRKDFVSDEAYSYFLSQETKSDDLLARIDDTFPISIQNYAWQIRGFMAHAAGLAAEAKFYFFQNLELFRSHLQLRKKDEITYKVILSNYLHSCYQTQSYEEFEEALQEFRALPAGDWDQEGEHFQNLAFYELLFYINRLKLEEAVERLPEICEKIERFGDRVNPARLLSFYYNFAILYYLQEDFSNCLIWLGNIRGLSKLGSRTDLQRLARLLEILLHLEAENYGLVDSLCRSTKREFQKGQSPRALESLCLDYLPKLAKYTLGEERKKLLKAFSRDLQSLEKVQPRRQITGLEEIFLWCDSRIGAISIYQSAKKRWNL